MEPATAQAGQVWGANSPHVSPVGPKSLSGTDAEVTDLDRHMKWALGLVDAADATDRELARAMALTISLNAVA